MTAFAVDSGHLNNRMVGVCIHVGHVLLHCEEKDDFWVMPGGRRLLFEASRDTLVREMEEEMMSLPKDSPFRDVGVDFTGQEGEIALLFRWIPIDHIDGVHLRPTFLRTALKAIPEFPVHVIHVDPLDEAAV